MVGKSLSHFRILSKIGEGGMGEVYRALDTKLDREVALKVLSPEMAADPDRLERFEREAKAVAALNHDSMTRDTLIRYELGRLEEEAGDHAGARLHYREFLDRRGDADLPLPQIRKARAGFEASSPS